MNDFHKEMAPVSADVVKSINELANPKWAIPFLGRRLNSICKSQFKEADTKGFSIELPWEGQVKYESHNAYDDSTYVHELVVAVYSEGPAAGRIKSVRAHHWEYWHTSSNWQDHSESHTWEKREPNEKEIEQYKELLEGWTEGGCSEQILSLTDALISIVRVQGGKIRVNIGDHKEYNHPDYKAISISISQEGLPNPVNIVINLDHLIEALDYSRIYVEAMHSIEDRRQLGICKDESWTLQYCLNFFDIFKTKELYQNIDLSLNAWLYKLYCSCSYYRDFMNVQSCLWWRDAWWRLQDIIEGKHRIIENKDLLLANCNDGGYYAKKQLLTDDPFRDLVGKLTIAHNRSIKPYAIEVPYWLYNTVNGQRVLNEFKPVVVNGIKWSISPRWGDEVAIDLAGSEEVEELKDGIAVIPYLIEGRTVTEVCVLKEVSKSWRKVVFAAPDDGDLDPDPVSPTSSMSDDEYEDDYEEDDDYVVPKYEKRLTINDGVFRGWQKLEEVVCERRSCSLGSYAFEGCPNLKKVDVGNNTIGMSDRCFLSCPALVEVGVIKGHIGAEAFKDCVSLKSIAMNYCSASSIVESGMGESAFAGCSALESVRIEESASDDKENKIYSLPRRTFLGCTSIKEIHLPKSVRILEEECLASCPQDCVLHYEGDAFWFIGKNALPELKSVYYWGKTIHYEKEEIVFSTLLDKLGIKRAQYVEACLKYQDTDYSISDIIGIIMGKKPPRRYNYRDYDDYDDYTPRTFEDAYEIYGSRLWDA